MGLFNRTLQFLENGIKPVWVFDGKPPKLKNGELAKIAASSSIVLAEANSEHWLAACWRPILMLTFGALIVARWFGFAAPDLSEAEYLKLWDIVELGLGGYVIGRSAEKIIPATAQALKK